MPSRRSLPVLGSTERVRRKCQFGTTRHRGWYQVEASRVPFTVSNLRLEPGVSPRKLLGAACRQGCFVGDAFDHDLHFERS